MLCASAQPTLNPVNAVHEMSSVLRRPQRSQKGAAISAVVPTTNMYTAIVAAIWGRAWG